MKELAGTEKLLPQENLKEIFALKRNN